MNVILLSILALAAVDAGDAEQKLAAGDFAGARTVFESLLPDAGSPAEQAALMEGIGRAWLGEGEAWEAERWFSRSLECAESAAAHLGRGRAWFLAGMRATEDLTSSGAEVRSLMNDAARELELALSMDATRADGWLVLGYVERYREDRAAEAAAFRKALAASPGHPEASLQVAWLEEVAGHGARAAEILSAVAPEARTSAHWKALGRIAAAAGDRTAAADAYRRAVRVAPDDAEAYVGLWEVTGREKRFAEFNADMEATGAAAPQAWLPDYYLGFSYRYDGKPEEAVRAFRRAQEKCPPDDFKPLVLAADVLILDLKREDEGVDLLLEVLRRDPANARAREVVAIVAYRRAQSRDLAAAEKYYRALAAADPTDWTYATDLALIFKETGRIEEAISTYRAAAERFPFEPQIPNDLALLYMGLGRKEEGEAALREALARDGEFLDSLENLGAFARLEGRLEEALTYFRRAYERVLREGGDATKFRRYLDMTAREIEDGK